MKYLWTEDSGSGFHYWELVNNYLFAGTMIVESKGSNQKLLDAVRGLHPMDGDVYYIAFDIVYDNMDIMNKYLELKELVSKYPDHIILLDVTCFEYVIFSFRYLVEWTGTGRKDKIAMREQIMAAFREHRIDISSITDPKTLNYLMGFKNYSTEKVLKSITAELTDQNAWSVKGEKMGKCWHEKMRCLFMDDETQRIVQSMR